MLNIIKKARKFVIQIIVLLLAVWLAFQFGECNIARHVHFPIFQKPQEPITVYKTFVIPKPGEHSIIWKIGHGTAKPDTEYIAQAPAWTDSVWTILRTEKKGKQLETWVKKDSLVKHSTRENVPPNFTLFGTKDGYEIEYNRFQGLLSWTGIKIGCRYGLTQEVLPYISTGIEIKRIELKTELNKEDLQADISLRLF